MGRGTKPIVFGLKMVVDYQMSECNKLIMMGLVHIPILRFDLLLGIRYEKSIVFSGQLLML